VTGVSASRFAGIIAPALAFGLLAVLLIGYFDRGFIPGDAFTYLAAGERLNAGHLLYALSPGDRPVDLNPPYWTVPFLSPPFMAVAWRPLAALPAELGVYAWWAGAIAGVAIVIGLFLRRMPVRTSLVVLVLAVPLTYEIGVGNVNAYLLLGAVGTWYLARRGRVASAGAVAAVMVAAKLTPLPLAAWVVGVGGRRGLVAIIVGLVACGIVSLVGAGLQAHVDYFGVARDTGTVGLSPSSLGGFARAAGLPDPLPTMIPTLVLVTATLASVGLASLGHPALGFAAAIVGWTFGSPVVNVNTPILLLALLAPVVWPWPAQVVAERSRMSTYERQAPVEAP
jgi:hypothetical protein